MPDLPFTELSDAWFDNDNVTYTNINTDTLYIPIDHS